MSNFKCSCGYTERDPDDDKEGCPQCGVGTQENPHKVMCEQNGHRRIPYGEWCICRECEYVQRSTLTFDYYASVGEALKCESCKIPRGAAMPRYAAEVIGKNIYGDGGKA